MGDAVKQFDVVDEKFTRGLLRMCARFAMDFMRDGAFVVNGSSVSRFKRSGVFRPLTAAPRVSATYILL